MNESIKSITSGDVSLTIQYKRFYMGGDTGSIFDGCKEILSKVKDAISIFIIPPSIEELERRLRGRNTEGEEVIQKRLKKAEEELALQSHYKYAVVNDEIDRVVKEVDEIFEKEVYAK